MHVYAYVKQFPEGHERTYTICAWQSMIRFKPGYRRIDYHSAIRFRANFHNNWFIKETP